MGDSSPEADCWDQIRCAVFTVSNFQISIIFYQAQTKKCGLNLVTIF